MPKAMPKLISRMAQTAEIAMTLEGSAKEKANQPAAAQLHFATSLRHHRRQAQSSDPDFNEFQILNRVFLLPSLRHGIESRLLALDGEQDR